MQTQLTEARDAAPPPPTQDSLVDLLADIERIPPDANRAPVIARYQAWIDRNGGDASPALFAAWFNLGAELSKVEDYAGAIDAYRHAVALRPDFHAAAVNLGLSLEAAGQPEAALAVWQQALQPESDRAMLLSRRTDGGGGAAAATLLHVGCGAAHRDKLPPAFRGPGWREIRLDIDPEVRPDLVASITDMQVVEAASVDAVYSSHNLEHLHPHEVARALGEMRRVLAPDGIALITLPDLQEVARHVAEGRLDEALYVSPMGPIAALDILYGHRASLAAGNLFMAHHTGFTAGTLGAALMGAGFAAALVQRQPAALALTAVGFRTPPDPQRQLRAQADMLAADLPAVFYRAAI